MPVAGVARTEGEELDAPPLLAPPLVGVAGRIGRGAALPGPGPRALEAREPREPRAGVADDIREDVARVLGVDRLVL